MTLLNLTQEAGLKPIFAAQTHGGEYHAACPKCGGTDRFRIQPNRKQKNCTGYFCCRQCSFYGDTIQFCRDVLGLTYEEAVIRAGGAKNEHVPILYAPKKKDIFRPANSKTPMNDIWHNKAITFVDSAHAKLISQPSILESLEQRGIPLDAAKQYKLGWHPENQHQSDWGGDKEIWIPKGLVIPLMLQGKINGIKIRRHDFKEGDKIGKYIVIPGGSDGFSIYGKTKDHTVLVIVESELDAITLQYAGGDTFCAIAIGGNSKNPTLFVDHLAQKAQNLLLIPDNDNGGTAMITKWHQLYPHARICKVPFGKDIGEAVQQGLQLCKWLLSAINTNAQDIKTPKTATLIEPQPSEPLPSTPVTSQVKNWSSAAQELITWFVKYIEYTEKYSPATRSLPFYLDTEQDIAAGPDGDHVEPLLHKLRMMRQTIEEAPIYKTSAFHAFMVK
jgi:DNA primase